MTITPTSFRLHKECLDILKAQSKRFKTSQTEVLEYMILEFAPSSAMETRKQRESTICAKEKFLKGHPDATIEQAWKAGYKSGWFLFQIRKSSHLFMPKDPDMWLSLQP